MKKNITKNNNAKAWEEIKARGITVQAYILQDDLGKNNQAVVQLTDNKNVNVRTVDVKNYGTGWKEAHYAGLDLAQTIHEETGIPLHWKNAPRYIAPAPTEWDKLAEKHIAKREQEHDDDRTTWIILYIVCFILWAILAAVFGFWIATGLTAACVYIVRRIG